MTGPFDTYDEPVALTPAEALAFYELATDAEIDRIRQEGER